MAAARTAALTLAAETVYAIKGGDGHGGYITDSGHNQYAATSGTGSHLILVPVGGPWFQIEDIGASLCLTIDPSLRARFESCASNQNNHWRHDSNSHYINQAQFNKTIPMS